MLLIRIVISSYKIRIDFKDRKLIFLFFITFIPIILMFITSLIGGIRVRTMWMTTFYVFPGIFFVYLFNSNILLEKFKKFYTIFLFIFLMLPIAYGADSMFRKIREQIFLEKKVLKIQTTWDETFPITSILLLEMDGYMVDGMQETFLII